MNSRKIAERYLVQPIAEWLRRPRARLQPLIARTGRPNIDLGRVAKETEQVATVAEPIVIHDASHWATVVEQLPPDVDAILPVSVPAYPTEWWNSHPWPLLRRRLPVIFWPILDHDEPDFWRWSATDMLSALGVEVYLAPSRQGADRLCRALAMRRFLKSSALVVFGEQNFPWNAHAAGPLVQRHLGTQIRVRPIQDIRERAAQVDERAVDELWAMRHRRYQLAGVRPEELRTALRATIAIRNILHEERALGFGVNCFGDLIISGARDVPCLAQTLLREEGFIASCDGDFLAMLSMVLTSVYLDLPCMMSNMYPVSYQGALRDHFGGHPLSPSRKYPRLRWRRMARLGHCGFVGVVSPEMTPEGRVELRDWGGTYEIPRDGRGCGNAGRLIAGQRFTGVELKFDGATLVVAGGRVLETTEHRGMPYCERTALLEFDDLEKFVANISREHVVLSYGDHRDSFRILARVLRLRLVEC